MTATRKTATLLALYGLVLAAWFVLPGCGSENDLVTPSPASQWANGDPASFSSPEGGLTDRRIVGGTRITNWTLVASGWVSPTRSARIAGSRYTLRFPTGSVAQPEFITILERDPLVADVKLGPHGTKFLIPVEATIDYRGTACDPQSDIYDGSQPMVYWYDPSQDEWQQIPSVADTELKRVTFFLEHFSRYSMSDDHTEDGEWQWTRTGKQTSRLAGEGPSE